MVSGQQQRPPRAQLLRNLGNHRLTGHTAGAAKVRNRQGSGIPCLLLPPAPLAWGWDASSRVSSGRNQGWREEEAEPQERNPQTDRRMDRRCCPGRMASTRLLLCLQLWLWVQGSAQELDPNGRNVCKVGSLAVNLACCPGWKQEGQECTTALCEGEEACGPEEVCVRPGLCRCKPGFFGADCSSPCPAQYWGHDCKRRCLCHPGGTCEAESGRCTCNPERWGELCQFRCPCGPHGRCDPTTGACRCEPGWWGPDCKKQCQCNLATSRCDPLTGHCHCRLGWWGRKCRFKCSCNLSPCAQETGNCKCKAGFWGSACQWHCDCLRGSCNPLNGHCSCEPGFQGRSCQDPCPAGTYGSQCVHSCGNCKHNQPCSSVDGFCLECQPGWNGTLCKERCTPGFYGQGCLQPCPHCRQGDICDAETGSCPRCEPGWTGPSCNSSCPAGTFGDGCQLLCPECVWGSCDPVSGDCLCQAGYWGASCNDTCPEGFFGVNCSSPCQCSRGTCHPAQGNCILSVTDHAALAAAILIPLLLLLLCVACCCCGAGPADARDRAAVPDDDVVARMKHHVQGVLANISAMMPCFTLNSSKLPKVTVSHHDAEIPFNPSFIESPSAAWASDSSFSSFDTDNEGPEYSVPPREGVPLLSGAELQAGMSPPSEALPDPTTFSSEDVSQPFTIPRTSSIAKAKRPSVSFAEGTKFSTAETPSPGRKPKALWGPSKLSLQAGDVGTEIPAEQAGSDGYESPDPLSKGDESHRPSPRATPGGRRRMVTSTRHVAQRVEALEAAAKRGSWDGKRKEPNVTTIYMTVGTAGQDPKAEGGVEGPVQAVLKRLGSLQRGKWAAKEEPMVRRSMEGIQKPPRRALAQRRDSANGCKQRESVPGAPSELCPGKQQHPPGKRQSFPLESTKSTGGQDGVGEGLGAAESGKSLELALSVETKGQVAQEEEPKYENVSSRNEDAPTNPVTT
ncbi:scavenger receptor class F member 1-like isoform X1 [Lagopus leucura]|uniref:scavenger receptor class F member 1-like isoform X1 n=1 Tax=Lagopus leucura TaxID=30410 RepID=UPI001C66E187|nr:scavenger receptor class F member 1-like isoform X1 [Lagopus leucura]